MKISRVGITGIIVFLSIGLLTNCTFYNQIKSRQDLVDGASAYKNRQFEEARELFRDAISRDPNGETQEGRTAQVFLARTLHSEYIANRGQREKAEQAITEYQKVLQRDISDQSSFKAVANLYENLQMQDQWLAWVTERANNTSVPAEHRAEALVTLAARKYTCANEISDTEATKKTVKKDGKDVYQFTKPASPEEFERLKQCAAEGLELVNKAVELAPNSDSAWSYKANLLGQQARIAEMDGNTAEQERLKDEADQAKERFIALNEEKKKREAEEEARKKAEAEAANKKK